MPVLVKGAIAIKVRLGPTEDSQAASLRRDVQRDYPLATSGTEYFWLNEVPSAHEN